MNRGLLSLINKKNDKYRDWKTTNNDFEYEVKKLTLKHWRETQNCKRGYYGRKTGILFQNVHGTKQ